MNLALLLDAAARSFPDHPAVSVGDERRYDYAAYGALSARLAGGFAALGRRPGDRVVLAMANNAEYLAILFALWRAGLVAVPVSAKLHAREIAAIAADCGAELCLATPDLADALAKALESPVQLIVLGETEWRQLAAGEPKAAADRRGDDLAWIFYTSGTTGRPKGAMLSHRNLMSMAVLYLADIDALGPDDCHIHLAAQSHATGLFGLSHIAKATHQVLPPSGGFSPAELADLLRLHHNATFFVPPTGLRRMLRDPAFARAPVENIRTVLLGAAPVYAADLKAGYEALGPRLWNGYGQGESPCTITAMAKPLLAAAIAAGDEARMASVGLARTGIAVAVVDADDRPTPAGEIGEVVVRGDTVMAGYWRRPEETAAALRGGWLHTGDLGAMDERGFLTLLDRAKDLVISGGANIYPREVEDVLLEDAAVGEAAVIGVPDPEWGESVLALVVPAGDAPVDLARLEALCLSRIARFKRPKYWRVVVNLPKNSAGKVLKRELRQSYAAEFGRAK
ncbi:MAG TPA: AMP-binding protein [Roseiarcus sp.]|nr:AMP-binding protein [Roseiarcus sp.]